MTLENVDLKRQTATVGIWAMVSWADEYLTWNRTSFQNVSVITVDPENIWLPDLAFGNFLRPVEFLKSGYVSHATVRRDGHVTIWPTLKVEFGIEAEITSYPFDTQECTLFVLPWSYPVERVRMHLHNNMQMSSFEDSGTFKKNEGELSLDQFELNGEWSVESVHEVNYTAAFETNMYDYIKVSFKLRRKWLYCLINIMGPVVLTSVLNIVCFQLPAESGEKVTLSISIFLTLVVFQNVVNSTLPESSEGLSILVTYIGLHLIGSALTITMTVVILKLHFKNGQVRVPHILGKFINCKVLGEIQAETTRDMNDIEPERKEKCTTSRKTCFATWQGISEKLNSFCFILAILWNICLISIFVLAV